MKPIDILAALDAVGDKATQGDWHADDGVTDTPNGPAQQYPEALIIPYTRSSAAEMDMRDAEFCALAANARPALKAHLAAVKKLVEAAKGAVSASELVDRERATDAGFLLVLRIADALRDALKEVDRDER